MPVNHLFVEAGLGGGEAVDQVDNILAMIRITVAIAINEGRLHPCLTDVRSLRL
jgi:hypothetical protein